MLEIGDTSFYTVFVFVVSYRINKKTYSEP